MQHTDNQQNIPQSAPGLYVLVLFAFMFNIIINPSALFPAIKPLHVQDILGGIAMICFAVGFLSSRTKYRWYVADFYYTAFTVTTFIGLLNQDAYTVQSEGLDQAIVTAKTWILFLMLSTALRSFQIFRMGFFVFLASITAFHLHGLKAYIMGAALFHGRFNSFVGMISNSDSIGACMVMVLPIFLELFLYARKGIHKFYALGSAVTCVILLVLTQTRSAFLSLLVVAVMWLVKKRNRSRKIVLSLALCGVVVIGGVFLAQQSDYDSYFARMKTIFLPDTMEQDSNASSRLLLWGKGLEIWAQFPLFGSGVQGMDEHVSLEGVYGGSLDKLSLHHSFIQVLAERGLIGFLFYCLFLLSIYMACNRSIRRLESLAPNSIDIAIAEGIRLSLVVFLINAQFMNITESWILIILGSISVGLWKLVRSLPMPGKANQPGELNA
jgi:O-antigen ligase